MKRILMCDARIAGMSAAAGLANMRGLFARIPAKAATAISWARASSKMILAWALLAGLAAEGFSAQQPPETVKTGIELAGRSDKETPPERWHIHDSSTKKEIAVVQGRWGFHALPPGEYTVGVQPQGYGSLMLRWATVTVAEGKVATVRVNSGIGLAGLSDKDPPLEDWYVYDARNKGADKKPVARVYQRWGFTPLPPGEYAVSVQPKGYGGLVLPWQTVTVTEGKVATVRVNSGIGLAGLSDKDPPLEDWYVYDARNKGADKKPVARVNQRWGFTPLPPGEYAVSVQPKGYGGLVLPWQTVTVAEGKVATVRVNSGIELAGLSDKDPPLEDWYVYDARNKGADKKPVARVNQRWGFTPLPPGEYAVSVQPKGYGGLVLPWQTVTVAEGKVATVRVNSGIELTGLSDKDPPLEDWYVYDARNKGADKKPVARVYQRWGFTPLPAGEYAVTLQPKGYRALVLPWATVTVADGKVTTVKVNSGIELVGRSEKDPPLEYWYVSDARNDGGDKKPVAQVYQRWGFQPLLPGKYAVSLMWKNGEESLFYMDVAVEKEKVVKVQLNSGIELAGATDKEPPPENWYVYDAKNTGVDKKPAAHVRQRWGFIAVAPGEYMICNGPGAFPWAAAKVTEGRVTRVRVPDVKERLARITGAGRKTEKERDPAGFKKLEEEIEKAIRRGGAWLKKQEMFKPASLDLSNEYLTIGILALLHAGEFERDSGLAERCIDCLLRRPLKTPRATYSTALTAMALRDMDQDLYKRRILECTQWLVENQGWDKERKVWGYGDAVPGVGEEKKAGQIVLGKDGVPSEVIRRGLVAKPTPYWDNSCSQFAILGLHSAVNSGIKIPRESWERVEQHFKELQTSSGGWGYNRGGNGSMTCAGLASSLIARHYLAREKPDPTVVKGLEWLAEYFTVEANPYSNTDHYYYLYGLERVGVLANTEFLGDHEWYPLGARYLLARQSKDGSWASEKSPPTGDLRAYLDTSYAILFLRRATLSYTPRPRPKAVLVVAPRKPPTLALRYQGKNPREPDLPPALAPAVELMLDASGSMNDPPKATSSSERSGKPAKPLPAQAGSAEAKYLIARRVLNQLLDDIPDQAHVGFRVFGHMGFWGNKPGLPAYEDPRYYTDSELMISIGALQENNRRKLIKDWVNYLKPAGATPLVYSLLQARKDFPGNWKGPKMVLLLSDGEENCGGKLEDVAKAYQGTGIDVIIHIVGLGVPPAEEKTLKEIARISGGYYSNTTNAQDLKAGLQKALRSTRYYVESATGEKTFGLINGPTLTMKAGTYKVGIPQTGLTPAQVRLEDGQAVILSLDEAGGLAVSRQNQPPTKASVPRVIGN